VEIPVKEVVRILDKAFDGASVSLDRQLDMVQFILRNNKNGTTYNEVCFYMRARHGLSKNWVQKFMKEWVGWGVIKQKGTKIYVDLEKWQMVLKVREDGFDIYGPR